MFESSWSIISAFIVFLLGYILIARISSYLGLKNKRALLIYIWHTVFCFVYFFYAQANGADSLMYYNVATTGRFDFSFGTSFVISITSLLVQGLGFGIVSCFLFFNILGSIGLLAFDGSLKQATKYKSKFLKKLATLIIFLPSVSFWSSAIGKDAISFLAMGLALWAALQLNKRVWLMVLAVFLMLIVRPHMAGMMIIALAMSVMFDTKSSPLKRFSLGAVAIAGAAVMVPFALEYAGVSDLSSSESLITYVENRQSYNMDGGGGVDIANMSLPMQLFTYMFRPIIFEARSVTALAAAVDNLILLYLFVIGSYALIKKKRKSFTENRKFMWVYVIIAWIVLAMTTANLGIAIRQKWMFAPILIFLLISLVGKNRNYSEY
ncbi:hypothetical protein [Psychrobacter proteolyticus]|uniref:hypothetical protein n=1 Tax=Psychrobacter proteolyticus TaxID=147825 RepID=UPI000E0A73D5|nr:hypothetical protein [Psychrobacter proteolyticus]